MALKMEETFCGVWAVVHCVLFICPGENLIVGISSTEYMCTFSPPPPQFFQRENKGKLSICSKVCYAIGGAPYQITGCALGFFLQIYLLDVAQVSPAA